ncbi:Ig-like domain-containing protein, partial [Thermoproteota archaeon]
GSVNPYQVTMDANHSLTAVFAEIPSDFYLTVAVTGSGSTVPAAGVHNYADGTLVNVTASPDSGWVLDYWLLDSVDVGSVNPYQVTMDANHSLTAIFVDNTPPTITIISPGESVTYQTKNVILIFFLDEEVSWMGYSLDGASNETILGNVTLPRLSKGAHNITVYANDTSGNMASSIMVNFSFQIDESPPIIVISSPENITYNINNVDLNFSVNEDTSWIRYNLDSAGNVTVVENSILTDFSMSLSGLSEGPHNIVVYANDTSGNIGAFSIFFSVDTTPPTIVILSPTSSTYPSPDVLLSFSINEGTSWIWYSLDGQNNITISGTTALSGLSEGSHDLVVYANDTVGNMGASSIISFVVQIPSVDTIPPIIIITSPQGTTYSLSEIALTFTINEPISWRAYSLDGEANITIIGNTILSGLTEGEHAIKIFATDSAGNTGASITTTFEIDTTPPIITLSSPEETTYSNTNVFLDFTLNEEVSWIGYALDDQNNITITADLMISALSEGSHSIIVFATDLAGNTGVSDSVQFSVSIPPVDSTPPTVIIISPESETYSSSSIALDFTIDEQTSWIGYSLDTQDNVTITEDTVLSDLSEGSHSIVVFATDSVGNTGGSEVIQFVISIPPIDTTPPIIIINSPENTTYDASDVLLNFTIDEPVSWIGYSLDGQENMTILDSIVLNEITSGEHTLIIYAEDLSGNLNQSNFITFTISTENGINSQIWAVAVLGIIGIAGLILATYIGYDLFKNRIK